VEETPVGASPDLVNHVWFQVDVKRPRNVFPRRGLGEERAEATIVSRWGAFDKATIGLDVSDQREREKRRRMKLHSDRVRRYRVPLRGISSDDVRRVQETYSRHFRSGHRPGRRGQR
jgi:hypothetical protein